MHDRETVVKRFREVAEYMKDFASWAKNESDAILHDKGVFSIPNFANCQGFEHVLNQLIPGPGNTFVATARPE